MLSLRERVHAEIDALTDKQLGIVLKEIDKMKENQEQVEERERIRLRAKKAFEDIRAECQNYPELTLDEINEEIRAARAERKLKQQRQLDYV